MNRFPMQFAVVAVLSMAGLVLPAAGQVMLYDNLALVNSGTSVLANLTPTFSFGMSFLSDALNLRIVDVKVVARQGVSPTGILSVSLWSDASGKPGTKLNDVGSIADSALVAGSGNSSSSQIVDFPNLALDVSPSTRYWVVMADSVSNGSTTFGTATKNYPAENIAIGKLPSLTVLSTYNGYMSVAAVPEPALEAAVVAGGLLAFGTYRLRRLGAQAGEDR